MKLNYYALVFSLFPLMLMAKESAIRPNAAIYGQDDRVEVRASLIPSVKDYARSIVTIIPKYLLVDQVGDSYSTKAATLAYKERLCRDEQFGDQISLGFCSGFLLAPNIILTAGHCFAEKFACGSYGFLFDYLDGERILKSSLFHCSKVLYQSGQTDLDYALIELDRPAIGRTPLKIRPTPLPTEGAPLFLIGSPRGVTLKVAEYGEILKVATKDYFYTNLDSFTANSGAPVINKLTGFVEGILVQGEADFYYDYQNQCMKHRYYDQYPTLQTDLSDELYPDEQESILPKGEKVLNISSILPRFTLLQSTFR